MAIHTNIFQKDSYITPDIKYLVNTYIREYDISKANINILLYNNIIDEKQYNFLYNLPKMDRQIYIGKLIKKDKKINKELSKGFKQSREFFFDANDIEEHEVLSIKKDAIYIISKIANNTKFGNIEFVLKNVYTSYYRLDNLELYYYLNNIEGVEILDVKGINNNKLHLHKDHFLDFINATLYEIQSGSIEDVLHMVQNFYNRYINLELDVGYYRSFNSDSLYYIKSKGYTMYKINNITIEDLPSINISVNRRYIEILYGYISNIILNKKRR